MRTLALLIAALVLLLGGSRWQRGSSSGTQQGVRWRLGRVHGARAVDRPGRRR